MQVTFACTQMTCGWDLDANVARAEALVRRAASGGAQIVLPVSFFERAGRAYYNAVSIIDADGRIAGHYRKSHIPDFPGYQEKLDLYAPLLTLDGSHVSPGR